MSKITNVSKVVLQCRQHPDGQETLEFFIESDEHGKKDDEVLSGAGAIAQFVFNLLADGTLIRMYAEKMNLTLSPDFRVDVHARDPDNGPG